MSWFIGISSMVWFIYATDCSRHRLSPAQQCDTPH
jgi:hypothetical protein